MTRRIRSFLYGMGSVVDLRPADDVHAEIARRRRHSSDRAALERDWKMIGSDVRVAMRRLEDEDQVARCG